MGKRTNRAIGLVVLVYLVFAGTAHSEKSLDLEWRGSEEAVWGGQRIPFRFDGYTNHWHRAEWDWLRTHGVFNMAQPSLRSEVWAMEEEIGNQLLLEEIWIEPGFVQALSGRPVERLDSPSPEAFRSALSTGDLLVAVTDQDDLAPSLLENIPEEFQFRRNRAFVLLSGERSVFVLASHSRRELDRLVKHLAEAVELVEKYDFHRGIAGVQTNFLHITTTLRHNPFDLIDLSLGLGCDWLMVCGFNDWMIPGPVNDALEAFEFPFAFISGQYVTGGVLYGMETYPDVQDNTVEECLDWAEEKGGFYFSSFSASDSEHADRFDGYVLGSTSDQGRLDELDAPFITNQGAIAESVPGTTLAFLEKGTPFNEETLMEAILAKRAVAVFEKGSVVGPPALRDGLRLLLLEGTALEEKLGGPIGLQAHADGRSLTITLQNRTTQKVEGSLSLQTPPGVSADPMDEKEVSLGGGETRRVEVPLSFAAEACGRDNPIAIGYDSPEGVARGMAHVDLPHSVELHPLIVDVPGTIDYPVTVYNFSDNDSCSLTLHIASEKGTGQRDTIQKTLSISPGSNEKVRLPLDLDVGEYTVTAEALGATREGLVRILPQEKTATAREEDLDGDGIDEIVMENETTRATVLLFGGRVIEYIVKSADENLMFKLWPEKPPLDGEIGGTRSFYPWGGLEEFTGYPYIGGHIVFKSEILEASGPVARVRVWANIHGSRISKIYSLYADSPLLEARYEMDEMTPSINVIGINPLFQIGPSTGPEDRYYFPEQELVETIPELERYYGRGVFPKEGWAAGYDTEMDISLLIGYPVNDAIYLHLWNNHPDNTPTPYYYTELQPWLELKHGTTTYFTYYVYGQEGKWKPLVEDFREHGLVTHRERSEPWNLE